MGQTSPPGSGYGPIPWAGSGCYRGYEHSSNSQEPASILAEDQFFFLFSERKIFKPLDLRSRIVRAGIVGGKEHFFRPVGADELNDLLRIQRLHVGRPASIDIKVFPDNPLPGFLQHE